MIKSSTASKAVMGALMLFLVYFPLIELLPLFIYFKVVDIASPLSISGNVYAAFLLAFTLLRIPVLYLYKRWATKAGTFRASFDFNMATIIVVTIVLLLLILRLSFSHSTIKFLTGWITYNELWGPSYGPINLALQFAYYVMEGLGMVWIVDSFQNAGEVAFRIRAIPWGGIGVAVTWGALHFLTQGFTAGVFAISMGLIFGVIYLVNRKSIWAPFLTWILYLII